MNIKIYDSLSGIFLGKRECKEGSEYSQVVKNTENYNSNELSIIEGICDDSKMFASLNTPKGAILQLKPEFERLKDLKDYLLPVNLELAVLVAMYSCYNAGKLSEGDSGEYEGFKLFLNRVSSPNYCDIDLVHNLKVSTSDPGFKNLVLKGINSISGIKGGIRDYMNELMSTYLFKMTNKSLNEDVEWNKICAFSTEVKIDLCIRGFKISRGYKGTVKDKLKKEVFIVDLDCNTAINSTKYVIDTDFIFDLMGAHTLDLDSFLRKFYIDPLCVNSVRFLITLEGGRTFISLEVEFNTDEHSKILSTGIDIKLDNITDLLDPERVKMLTLIHACNIHHIVKQQGSSDIAKQVQLLCLLKKSQHLGFLEPEDVQKNINLIIKTLKEDNFKVDELLTNGETESEEDLLNAISTKLVSYEELCFKTMNIIPNVDMSDLVKSQDKKTLETLFKFLFQ